MRTNYVWRTLVIVAFMLMPAALAASAPPELSTFKDVQSEPYVHASPAFTLQYPYTWRVAAPDRPGQLVLIHGATKSPGISVSRADRPAGLSLNDSAVAAAQRLSPKFVIESQRDVKLGAVPARAVVGRWIAPFGDGLPLRTLVVSAFVDQDWMLVLATDGVSSRGVLPELERAALSIRFGATGSPAR